MKIFVSHDVQLQFFNKGDIRKFTLPIQVGATGQQIATRLRDFAKVIEDFESKQYEKDFSEYQAAHQPEEEVVLGEGKRAPSHVVTPEVKAAQRAKNKEMTDVCEEVSKITGFPCKPPVNSTPLTSDNLFTGLRAELRKATVSGDMEDVLPLLVTISMILENQGGRLRLGDKPCEESCEESVSPIPPEEKNILGNPEMPPVDYSGLVEDMDRQLNEINKMSLSQKSETRYPLSILNTMSILIKQLYSDKPDDRVGTQQTDPIRDDAIKPMDRMGWFFIQPSTGCKKNKHEWVNCDWSNEPIRVGDTLAVPTHISRGLVEVMGIQHLGLWVKPYVPEMSRY